MSIDDLTLSDLYDFLEFGSINNAPPNIVEYVQVLDKIRGMHLRIDKFGSKEAIIKHLIAFEGYSRHKANSLYEDSLEYFYSDSKISKNAWRNIIAEKMMKNVTFAELIKESVLDAEKVQNMYLKLREVLELDKEDKEELPKELFSRPVKIYSVDAEFLGLPSVNRNRLAEMIDSFPELSEKERLRIKQESLVIPLKAFPNEQEDPRKS
jgi:hypothetical protein